MTFGFIICSYINSSSAYQCLVDCITSIRKFHPDNKIIIIDDHSPWDFKEFVIDQNTIRIISQHKGCAEMNPYYYYYFNNLFDRAIIIHDSFHLLDRIENIENIDIQFIWHFNIHRYAWNIFKEEQTQYNIENKIITHDDKIIDFVKKSDLNDTFKDWFNKNYFIKNSWTGCFGIMSIISHTFLCLIQKKTNMLSTLKIMKDKRDRMVMESVFALICQFVKNDNYENSYDGLYYDGLYHNSFRTNKFVKISLNR